MGFECNVDECCVFNNFFCGCRFLDIYSYFGYCVFMGMDGFSKSEIYCINLMIMIFQFVIDYILYRDFFCEYE